LNARTDIRLRTASATSMNALPTLDAGPRRDPVANTQGRDDEGRTWRESRRGLARRCGVHADD